MYGYTQVSSRSLALSSDAARPSSSALNNILTCATSTRLTLIAFPNRVAAYYKLVNFFNPDSKFTSLSFLDFKVHIRADGRSDLLAWFEWAVAPQCLGGSIIIRIKVQHRLLCRIINSWTSIPNFLKMALCKVYLILHKTNIQILNLWLQIIMPFRIR